MSASNYLENKLLDHVCKRTAYTQPANLYLALFTGSPATNLEAGTLTNEVSGNGYARTAIAFNNASGGSITNSATVSFPVATGSWSTITYVAVMDALTAGNVLFYGALVTPKTVSTDDIFQIQASNLTITLD
jgi:hypothetical protein